MSVLFSSILTSAMDFLGKAALAPSECLAAWFVLSSYLQPATEQVCCAISQLLNLGKIRKGEGHE